MKPWANPKRGLLGVGLLAGGLVAGLGWFRVGAPPVIEIEPQLPAIGRATPVIVRAAEPSRGLTDLVVELEQAGRVHPLAERNHQARPFWAFWGSRVQSDELTFDVGSESLSELQEGEATLRVVAGRAPTWFRRPGPVRQEITLAVRLRPPAITVTSQQTYVAQGGSEAVVYTVGPSAVRDGVRVGEYWFPGYPLPGGGSGARFALFGVPHDHPSAEDVQVMAVDDVGNELAVPFVDRFIQKPLRTDTIRLSDRFMARVVPQIVAQTPGIEEQGDLLASYLMINRDLRRQNTETLFELAGRSRPEFLWRETFLQLPNMQSMASFADRRTYVYDGREVDQQDHLGFDLASVRQAPVLAGNRGIVVLAEYFGIYGKTVVLDHGHGLLTLYAHLSAIDVVLEQEVERGAILGKTGETGLAGGDHLHFSVLLGGLQVNPLEWWDREWIKNRIAAKLEDALPFDG